MNERLAVEAELEALHARGVEALLVVQVEVYAVEDREPVRAPREEAHRERRQPREPLARARADPS